VAARASEGAKLPNLLSSIHALRFVGATAVVCHHAGLGEQFGTSIGGAGVDLFFVISGVVIGASTTPGMPIRDFMWRRFIRIFPLYWLATAAVIAFKAYFWHIIDSPSDLLHSVFLVPPDLSSEWKPLVFVGWTLTFELFFYFTFALCMLLGRHARLACCFLMIIAAFALSDQAAHAYLRNSAMLMLEFVAGVLISFAIERKLIPGVPFGLVLVAAGVGGFIAFAFPPMPARELAWGIPSVLLVYGMLAFEPARWLRHPFIVLGGHASYAIYLFHTTVMSVLGVLFFIYGTHSDKHPWLFAAIAIPVSVGFGMLVYLAFDKPVLRYCGKILVRPCPAPAH